MKYIVFNCPQEFHQMSIEDFLFGNDDYIPKLSKDATATRTYRIKHIEKYKKLFNVEAFINLLSQFNEANAYLHEVERRSLYYEFYIPKKSGGLRKIDTPELPLMTALRTLKDIIETQCSGGKTAIGRNARTLALYHTSAFAYVKNRSTVDAVRKHQQNDSRWFAKFDLSNFFGSITKEYTMHMLSMIYPFSEVIADVRGKRELETAIDLAFLDGVLPQGTPLSPLITNIIMIPIDCVLFNGLRNFEWENRDGEKRVSQFVYTRYADDFIISSQYSFNHKKVEEYIVYVLEQFEAPFKLNKEKTRYGSRAGHNVNLGVYLNNENEITIGHKKKRQLLSMLAAYAKDKSNGRRWEVNDVRVMEGYRRYYMMVEGDDANLCIKHLSDKLGVDIPREIANDLRG